MPHELEMRKVVKVLNVPFCPGKQVADTKHFLSGIEGVAPFSASLNLR